MNNYIYILVAVVVILVVARILYILSKQDKCLIDIQKELLKEQAVSKEFGEAFANLKDKCYKLGDSVAELSGELEDKVTELKDTDHELDVKYGYLSENFNAFKDEFDALNNFVLSHTTLENDIPKQEQKQTSKKKAKKKKEDPNLNNTVEEL